MRLSGPQRFLRHLMIRGAIFDFDGTLVDSNAIKQDCFFEVAQHLPGARKHLIDILSDPGAGDRYAVFAKLAEHYADHPDHKADAGILAEQYTQSCELRVTHAPAINGAQSLLDTLHKSGLHLAISSATPQPTLQRIVTARGMAEYFSDILGKPDEKTAHIDHVRGQLDVDASKLVYIGDSEIDQQSARARGCRFIGVGKDTDRFEATPKYMVEDLTEVLSVLVHIRAV